MWGAFVRIWRLAGLIQRMPTSTPKIQNSSLASALYFLFWSADVIVECPPQHATGKFRLSRDKFRFLSNIQFIFVQFSSFSHDMLVALSQEQCLFSVFVSIVVHRSFTSIQGHVKWTIFHVCHGFAAPLNVTLMNKFFELKKCRAEYSNKASSLFYVSCVHDNYCWIRKLNISQFSQRTGWPSCEWWKPPH